VSDSGGYEDDRSWWRTSTVVVAAGIVLCAIVGWFIVRPALPDDADTPLVAAVPRTELPAADTTPSTEPPTTRAAGPTGNPRQTRTPPPTTEAPAVTEAPVVTDAPAAVDTAPVTSTAESNETPETTAAAETTVATEPAPATTAGAPDGSVTYDTLPDGSPAPVVAVFGVDQITITGAVPSQAAKERLQALAIANAKPGQDANIANFLTVNPDVPIGVGVRVVELTSARFPEGSAEILPAHGAELNRILAIMQALPNVTALIIGHADQRGDEGANYQLSAQRADAVVRYLALQGMEPSRLSSRAVGEAELLTLNSDDVALALNRRTEVIFYGLLIG
jgi:OmpA-OmpF porin, OOP family